MLMGLLLMHISLVANLLDWAFVRCACRWPARLLVKAESAIALTSGAVKLDWETLWVDGGLAVAGGGFPGGGSAVVTGGVFGAAIGGGFVVATRGS